jgi:predicted ATPase/DNA-binding SARP family transcriptional activator
VSSVRILGTIEAWADGKPLVLGGPRQVGLLAVLAVRANRAISSDALIDALWGEERLGARKRLQMTVMRLRQALAPLDTDDGPALRTVGGGYLLVLAPGELDAEAFQSQLEEGRAALRDGAPALASELLSAALALWRGPPLAEVYYEEFAQTEIRRLEELRLLGLEARAEAELELGHYAAVIAELEGVLVEQPSREGIATQLMLALYRSGRQAEALAVYQRTSEMLAEQLGLEPGPALRSMQRDILKHAPSLVAPSLDRRADDGPRGADHLRIEDRPPARATALIGREQEVEDLCALLADPDASLVTLTGMGGAGKTALALRVARELGQSFPDGVTVVWLANISEPAQVLLEVARRLGVDLSSQEPPPQTLVRVLRFQRRLLVLDNFEHVLDAGPAVATLVAACGQLKVLVTSRAPLRVSFERVYTVAGLAVPSTGAGSSLEMLGQWSATALFLQLVRAADPSFRPTPDAVRPIAELCRYLGGLPLALELAAARARVLAPEQILDRLRTLATPLGPGRRDAPERHRSLQKTIDWSLDLLTADQQKLFAVLGVFVGGFTVDGAQAVCGEAVPDVLDGVATLLDHSLIQRIPARHGPRLGMLEPIREAALRRLRADDSLNKSALARHAEFYADLAESAANGLHGDRQLERLDELQDELGNVRAVLAAASAQPQLDLALRVASAPTRFWAMRDLGSEIHVWMRWALDQPPGDPVIRTRALVALGSIAATDWAYDEATTTLAGCLAACYELGDPELTARCEANLALCFSEHGDTDSLAEHTLRALNLAAGIGDPWAEAYVWAELGIATESPDVAYVRLRRALDLYRSLGDRLWSSHIKSNLAWYAIIDGDYAYARRLCEEGAVEGRGIWGASQRVQLESHLGLADLFEGRRSDARRHLGLALALARSLGWWVAAQEALAGLAAVAAIEGRSEDAATLAGAAHVVTDKGLISTGAQVVYARLNDLSGGLLDAARAQPAPSPQQLDAILRDASEDQAVEERRSPNDREPTLSSQPAHRAALSPDDEDFPS